jgi:succinate dehydrogenase / fumarate reductase flavoprotein subunit
MGLPDPRLPGGDLASGWQRCRDGLAGIAPANRRRFELLVVGSGLAGASAAATLAEQGYRVTLITFHDSPRRAHSVAAQGGINAAKNYAGDGDSVERLFHDTVRGGDFRAREAGCHRLAEISNAIIDQCVAQGVPFAREYGGSLANRSFGGARVSRTFYARGQTGQQLLLGAYQALMRQVAAGRVRLRPGCGVPRAEPGRPGGAHRPRRAAGERRLQQRVSPLHQRPPVECQRHLASPPARGPVRQPLLHPDPSHLHSRR